MTRDEAISLAARAAMRLIEDGAAQPEDFDIHLSEIVRESSLARAAFTDVALHRDAGADAETMRRLEDVAWRRAHNVGVIGLLLLASLPYLPGIEFDNPVLKEGLDG